MTDKDFHNLTIFLLMPSAVRNHSLPLEHYIEKPVHIEQQVHGK